VENAVNLNAPISEHISNLMRLNFRKCGSGYKTFDAFTRKAMANPEQWTTKSIPLNSLGKPFNGTMLPIRSMLRVQDAPRIRGCIPCDQWSEVHDREIWTGIYGRLLKTIHDALKHLLRPSNHAIGKVLRAIAPGLQLPKPECCLSCDYLRALIYINSKVLGERSRLKRNWSIGTRVDYSPFYSMASVFGHRLLYALQDFKIVSDLIKQIIDGRGITLTPSLDAQFNRPAHDLFALQGAGADESR
jgi:hypothetical protein